MSHEVAMPGSSICGIETRLDDRPVLVAHGVGERVDEFLVGPIMLVIDEMVEPSRRECGDKSLVLGVARARDRRLEAVEQALRRGGTSGLDGPADDDALARRRARALARYAGDGADAVHVGIEGTEGLALARRFAHAADLARLQRPRAEPSHLLVEPSDIERRPVFAVADAVEADFDLALHHVRNHPHDLRCHLLAADLAACKAEGCLLEARRYGQPPHVAGTDSLCAILHRSPPVESGVVSVRAATATMIDTRYPPSMREPG